jgi:sugar phosphate isomerase/epimerase
VTTVTRPHPRLSINSASSYQQSLAEDLALWKSLGVDHVGLVMPKLIEAGIDAAVRMITEADLRISTLFGPSLRPLDAGQAGGWFAEDQEKAVEAIELARQIGASSVYVTTGGAPSLAWDDAAATFTALISPAVERGAKLGIPLLIEATNSLRCDLSFVFWQRDALELARRSGTKIVLDVQSSWYERGLAELLRTGVEHIGLVQLSDFVIGTGRSGDRAVPGDGDIPLQAFLQAVVDAGYSGAFDLEVFGPRIEAEGYPSSLRRSIDRASELLVAVGA